MGGLWVGFCWVCSRMLWMFTQKLSLSPSSTTKTKWWADWRERRPREGGGGEVGEGGSIRRRWVRMTMSFFTWLERATTSWETPPMRSKTSSHPMNSTQPRPQPSSYVFSLYFIHSFIYIIVLFEIIQSLAKIWLKNGEFGDCLSLLSDMLELLPQDDGYYMSFLKCLSLSLYWNHFNTSLPLFDVYW